LTTTIRAASLAALLIGTALPAAAQVRLYSGDLRAGDARKNVPGDYRTAAGAFILPRYLAHVGDYELSLEQFFVPNAASLRVGTPLIPQFAAGYKVLPGLDLMAVLGPTARVGARGPFFGNDFGGIGWSAGFRVDDVALWGSTPAGDVIYGQGVPGVAEPLGQWFVPGIGFAQGGELRLDTLRRFGLDFGFLDLALSPVAIVQGNRTAVGADFGADLTFERWQIGYAGEAHYNAFNPFERDAVGRLWQPLSALAHGHSLGSRVLLDDRFFAQVAYKFQIDSYGKNWHLVSAGIGFRPLTPDPEREPE